ncbi:hypothetical protein L195_g048685, partial [Trifolium pratense]
MRTVIPRKGGN